MFIWGQVHTDTPFYFPNREALLDLYRRHRQHAGRRAARAQPRDDRTGGRRSDPDQRSCPTCCSTKSPIQLPHAQHASRKDGARAADRPRNGIDPHGEADHAEQGRAVRDRRLAERRRSTGLRGAEREQLVPGDDADRRQSGARPTRTVAATLDLIYEVERPRAVRVLHPVDLHAAPRHADGDAEGRDRKRSNSRRCSGS